MTLSHSPFRKPARIRTSRARTERGFALVISLSLMVLLTILAVGLLTLSTVSLRGAANADAMQVARANARMALTMAIGQLQKQAGPDQRITASASVADESHPAGVTGTWKSWRPKPEGSDYRSEKADRFTGYLMSNTDPAAKPNAGSIPSSGEQVLLVGKGTLGVKPDKKTEVNAPIIPLAAAGSNKGAAPTGALAWNTIDEGVKGRIDLAPAEDKSQPTDGELVSKMGAPARNKAGQLDGLDFLDGKVDELTTKLPKLVSTGEVGLAASTKDVFGKYFHDFSVSSNSLQTDAANGGLKTDLSVLFDTATLPTEYSTKRLYSNTSSPLPGATNSDPMWAALQHYYRLYQRTTANDNPKQGMKAFVSQNYRVAQVSDQTLRDVRYEPNMATLRESIIMPTLSRVDIVFSLIGRDPHGPWAPLATAGYTNVIHLMYLPVITLHNPYNVPLRFTEIEVEFQDLPMGFQFFVDGKPCTAGINAFNQLYTGKEGGTEPKIFKVTLSGDLNAAKEIVMGPGETRIFGKPFPPEWTWAQEVAANGDKFFDWQNNKTGNSNRVMPGMITGPNDGVGYDLDWVTPGTNNGARADWLNARSASGMLPVKPNESVSVKYGPKTQMSPDGSKNKFAVKMRLKTGTTVRDYATTQVFFQNEVKLKSILEEGTSPRFTEPRSFPETYPKPTVDAPVTAASLHEDNGTQIKKYTHARPFAIFSLSGKTTQESFTRSRPAADTGAAVQMATCEFITNTSQGANPYEFTLTPVRSGTAAMEFDGEKAFFFGGHGNQRGETAATYFEIPVAPLQSVAQLRHANTGTMGSAPYFTYSVGESRAHPALPSNAAKFNAASNRTLLDHSWLANDQLWDKYYFSTLASLQGTGYTGSAAKSEVELANDFFAGTSKLPNPRNIACLPAGMASADAASKAIEVGGAKSAAYLMTRGGFNVNSTSESAWVSVLSALSDAPVPIFGGSVESTGKDVPMLRTRRPSAGSNSGGRPLDQLWNSYRKLNSGEIHTLAQEMVKQVRKRGPFLSMADFVNRNLADSELAKNGAVQAALDASGINGIINSNALNVDPTLAATYNWKNPSVITNTNTAVGTPGDITQGDVLTAIGSFATVRSDTFKIRAYGEARDKDNKVIARAWCEAVVQRFPDYVDSHDAPEVMPDANANTMQKANQNFGRRFQTISFRWMNKDEV